jgi:hypothetical protein
MSRCWRSWELLDTPIVPPPPPTTVAFIFEILLGIVNVPEFDTIEMLANVSAGVIVPVVLALVPDVTV